jgi:UTP:GlnB (protein PII) uridylyltransferase
MHVEAIFRELEACGDDSLIATCYSGRPRAALLPDVQEALTGALKQRTKLAMFFPYPLELRTTASTINAHGLLGRYIDTWKAVEGQYDALRAAFSTTERDSSP